MPSPALLPMELLACPCCKEVLSDFLGCHSCGAQFKGDDPLPSLIPTFVAKDVSFRFTSERSTASPQFQKVFAYPDVNPGTLGLPYHLDKAHAVLIDALPQGSIVLEIGCGGGQMREHLKTRGVQYVGVDISDKRVGENLRTHGGPDLLADAHFLPFRDQSFDFVYTSAVVEHLACPQLAAQEIFRVLKPNAVFVGSVSFLEPWHDDSFYHMTPLGVFEWLTQARLMPVNIWPGRGYSGFNALMSMGNQATEKLRILGKLNDAIYRSSNSLRDRIRRRPHAIADDAKVAGSTDWIARRELGTDASDSTDAKRSDC